jgi:hypothetical protein
MAMEPIDTGTPEGGNTPPRPVKKITVKEIKRKRLADQNAKMCRALAQDDGVTLSDYVTLNYNPDKIAKIYKDYVEEVDDDANLHRRMKNITASLYEPIILGYQCSGQFPFALNGDSCTIFLGKDKVDLTGELTFYDDVECIESEEEDDLNSMPDLVDEVEDWN